MSWDGKALLQGFCVMTANIDTVTGCNLLITLSYLSIWQDEAISFTCINIKMSSRADKLGKIMKKKNPTKEREGVFVIFNWIKP